MSDTQNLKLARLLKTLLDILFGLSLFAFSGLLLWTAISPIVLRQPDTFGTVTVPVRIGTGSEPQLDVRFASTPNDRINEAFVEQAEGTLVITTTNALPVVIANASKVVLLAGLTYIFYLTRRIVISFRDGDPFAAGNVNNIRRMGYMILVLGVAGPVLQFIVAREILGQLPRTIPALQAGPAFDSLIIFVALFILLLAQIWSYGLALEREHELTI